MIFFFLFDRPHFVGFCHYSFFILHFQFQIKWVFWDIWHIPGILPLIIRYHYRLAIPPWYGVIAGFCIDFIWIFLKCCFIPHNPLSHIGRLFYQNSFIHSFNDKVRPFWVIQRIWVMQKAKQKDARIFQSAYLNENDSFVEVLSFRHLTGTHSKLLLLLTSNVLAKIHWNIIFLLEYRRTVRITCLLKSPCKTVQWNFFYCYHTFKSLHLVVIIKFTFQGKIPARIWMKNIQHWAQCSNCFG